jgi:hypothetical protein
MFEKIGNFSDFCAMVCEGGPFFVFIVFCLFFVVYVFLSNDILDYGVEIRTGTE